MVGKSGKLRADDGQACGWMMGRQGSDDVAFIFIFHSLFFLSALGPSNFSPTGQGGHSVGKFGFFFFDDIFRRLGWLAGSLVAVGGRFPRCLLAMGWQIINLNLLSIRLYSKKKKLRQ
jgi:hypothetical protein